MILAVLVGCFAAYYFGLRIGGYVAGATFVLDLLAFFVPTYKTPLHALIAIGMIAIWWLGSRRPIPADSALALRGARAAVKKASAYVRSFFL